MPRQSFLATALLLALAFAGPARACGEGLFNMGQGLRYQGYLAPRPATVLVYEGERDAGASRTAIYAGLARAGHRVTVAHDAGQLAQSLQSHRYDVVIADLDRIAVVSRDAGAGQPALLPVVARSQRDAPELRQRFRLFVPDGASLGQYLKAINQLLPRP